MDLRKLLCLALIQPHFDYACSSGFDGLSKSLQNKLQVSQNEMIRFILSPGNRDSVLLWQNLCNLVSLESNKGLHNSG